MATHDYSIANQTGANFRSDVNNALKAIVSNNYGSTDPATLLDAGINGQCQWWADSASNSLKLRNTADSSWVTVGALDAPFLNLAPTHYFRLDSDLPRAASSSAQSIFGVGCSLLASTVYEFEMVAMLKCDPNSTTLNVRIGFDCSSTPNNFHYQYIILWDEDPGTVIAGVPDGMGFLSTNAATILTSNAANDYFNIQAKGTISVNAATTFTPEVTFSSATPLFTTNAGSYIKLRPISAAGANTNIGGWS